MGPKTGSRWWTHAPKFAATVSNMTVYEASSSLLRSAKCCRCRQQAKAWFDAHFLCLSGFNSIVGGMFRDKALYLYNIFEHNFTINCHISEKKWGPVPCPG